MTEEQRDQLARLMAVEHRVLGQLPSPDFSQLRSTTNARESGIELRGPDTDAATAYLLRLRDRVGLQVAGIGAALPRQGVEAALATAVELVRRTLEELARAIELISTALYPRVSNPTVLLGEAIERAAAPRNQPVTVECSDDAHVQQVRGLMRFLSELIGAVGDSAYVHVSREGAWVYATFSPLATGGVDAGAEPDPTGPTYPRDQLLRLAAYLLRVNAERVEGGWRATFVGV